jgi:lipoprotein NlpI
MSWAQPGAGLQDCPKEAEGHELVRAIEHCTELILSGRLSPAELAEKYTDRGLAHHKRKDYERAIQDYDHAIALTPKDNAPFIGRANAYQEKRQYDRALADYETAALLGPTPGIERSRAFLFFYLGRMTQSAESFERYLKSHPEDVAAVLFRYLAEAKIGNSLAAARDLEADAAKITSRGWPLPVIDFYLGRMDEKAIFAAADSGDPKLRNDRICLANFHTGQSRLFRAYLNGAIPLLRAAVKDCPSHGHESHAAASELHRLGRE